MKATPAAEVESPSQAATEKGEEEESCRSCLYTGLATCAGLSAYFLHLALEEQPSKQKPTTDATIRRSNNVNIPRSSTHTQKQPIDLFERSKKLMQQKSPPTSNKRFHLAFSAAWAIAGMYRLYLN